MSEEWIDYEKVEQMMQMVEKLSPREKLIVLKRFYMIAPELASELNELIALAEKDIEQHGQAPEA